MSQSSRLGATKSPRARAEDRPRVGLFVTCLVNQFRPSIAWSALDLLEEAGCEVTVPQSQTCCGQPAFNSGDEAAALPVALTVLDAFAGCDYVVAPSGSCAGMIRCHLPALVAKARPERAEEAANLAARCYELTSFLVDVMDWKPSPSQGDKPLKGQHIAYHDSCSGLRELGVRDQPRTLLADRTDAQVSELADRDACCGFGGTFCVKQPEVSTAIADEKIRKVEQTGASILAAGDFGCLMHLSGRIKRSGKDIAVYHTAEILAGRMEQGGICDTGSTDDIGPDLNAESANGVNKEDR